MFGFVLDWCRYKQLVMDRDSMDSSGPEVVADYFGLVDMKQEGRRRRKQQRREKVLKKARTREEKREKEERHMEMMENLNQMNQLLDQIRSEQEILGLASLD